MSFSRRFQVGVAGGVTQRRWKRHTTWLRERQARTCSYHDWHDSQRDECGQKTQTEWYYGGDSCPAGRGQRTFLLPGAGLVRQSPQGYGQAGPGFLGPVQCPRESRYLVCFR